MFRITDEVEMGHSVYTGGTIVISVGYNEIQNEEKIKNVLKVIDYLDHCLLTDNNGYLKYSERYFLIEKSESIFDDVIGVISNFINDFEEITVSLGKLSYTSKHKPIKLISYSTKG